MNVQREMTWTSGLFLKLEIKLSKVEEQCLEKELILEQVHRLAERLSNKLDTSKDDTLNLAKKVNQIQSQIKDTTKKMMAAVSELSIAQSTALKLQEEVKSKEIALEQAYNRMDKGEAPSAEIEREWLRTLDMDEKVKERQQVRVRILNCFFQDLGISLKHDLDLISSTKRIRSSTKCKMATLPQPKPGPLPTYHRTRTNCLCPNLTVA